MEWLDTHSGSVQALATLVLVVITAYYAWTSRALVRQTRTSLQATARTTLQGRLDRISEILIEHPELSEGLDKPASDDEESDAPSHVANLLWAVLEEAHTQYAVDRSMPEEDWRAWAATIDFFIHRPYLNTHWRRAGRLYGDSFQRYVDERLKLPPQA
jgi:hypothetical protein